MSEILQATESISELYVQLTDNEPKPVANFVPQDATAQRELFLSGEQRNPNHTYTSLSEIDFDERVKAIHDIGQRLVDYPNLNPKYKETYQRFIDDYSAKTHFMELANKIKTATDEVERNQAKEEFMTLNKELYGEPDETTYRSLLQEKLGAIAGKNLDTSAEGLRGELLDMISFDPDAEPVQRFKPEQETIEWMHGVVETMYGGMLSHVPDDPLFNEQAVKAVFDAIIAEEFGESAHEWTVDIEPAKSINVKSTEKRIVIPDDRGSISNDNLRKLVVHEVGVHMLRSVMGGQSDLDALKNGLSEYYDSEEGMGKVMEQALDGTFTEAGVDHYITAGLAHFDEKDFRDIFEVKWRLKALEDLKDGEELTEARREKAKNAAYKGTTRMFRGTDELPWFKDLSYYNGTASMWRHLEAIRGDDLLFTFVLLGKADPTKPEHMKTLLELGVNPDLI